MTPATFIDAPSLQDRLRDQGAAPRVVDVRSPAEYESGHIPGAVNVPLDALQGSLDELCSSGGRRGRPGGSVSALPRSTRRKHALLPRVVCHEARPRAPISQET